MSVPKIIHCCWFGGTKTPLAERCRASWARFAPDWEVHEKGLSSLAMWEPLPVFVQSALAAKKWAMVSDWARMKSLYEEGGVYFDFDVEFIRPLVVPEGEWGSSEWSACGDVWLNPGSGIALTKGSPIAKAMLDYYETATFDGKTTVGAILTDLLKEKGLSLRMLKPEIFSPIDICGRLHKTDETIAIHHYALSWGGPFRKVMQWMSWHHLRWVIVAALKVRNAILRRG